MNGNGRTAATWATVGVALLALLVAPALAAPASASPTALAGSNTQQWAYGAQKWVNVTENFGNATYDAHAFFGWQVIFTATNTSATTVALEAQRTLMGSYYAELCSPNCSNPSAVYGNLSVVGWERDAGFANLTTTASVYENGSAVPAVGLSNASAQISGNISEQLTARLATSMFNGSTSSSLFVNGAAHHDVSFSPSLGLVPQNVSSGDEWNSSAAFVASGGWSIVANWAHTSFAGTKSSGSFTPSGSVESNGTVQLNGADIGSVTLRNGQTVPAIAIEWSGPFDDMDGVILVPHDFDMFGTGGHAWASEGLLTQAAATSNIDIGLDAAHHLRVVAAATAFSESDTSLSTQASSRSGPAPAAATTGATELQAQPESVAQAQSASGCYVSQCAPASAASGIGSLGVALLVGLVVAVVVGSVSVIEYRVWARRRAGASSSSATRPAVPPAGAYGGQAPPPPPVQEPPRSG